MSFQARHMQMRVIESVFRLTPDRQEYGKACCCRCSCVKESSHGLSGFWNISQRCLCHEGFTDVFVEIIRGLQLACLQLCLSALPHSFFYVFYMFHIENSYNDFFSFSLPGSAEPLPSDCSFLFLLQSPHWTVHLTPSSAGPFSVLPEAHLWPLLCVGLFLCRLFRCQPPLCPESFRPAVPAVL